MTFNRKDKEAYKKGTPIPSPALASLPNYGRGLSGVWLLGRPEDYRKASFFFFSPGPHFSLPSGGGGSRGLTGDGYSWSGVRVDSGASFTMILNDGSGSGGGVVVGEEGGGNDTEPEPPSPSSYCFTLPNESSGEVGGLSLTLTLISKL